MGCMNLALELLTPGKPGTSFLQIQSLPSELEPPFGVKPSAIRQMTYGHPISRNLV